MPTRVPLRRATRRPILGAAAGLALAAGLAVSPGPTAAVPPVIADLDGDVSIDVTPEPVLPATPNANLEQAHVVDRGTVGGGQHWAVVDTRATNLVVNDTNNLDDAYLINIGDQANAGLPRGGVRKLTTTATGGPAFVSNGDVLDGIGSLALDPTGRHVALISRAPLVSGIPTGGSTGYLHDIAANHTHVLPSTSGASKIAVSSDARVVLTAGTYGVQVAVPGTGVVTSVLGRYNGTEPNVTAVAISADGRQVAFATASLDPTLPYAGPTGPGQRREATYTVALNADGTTAGPVRLVDVNTKNTAPSLRIDNDAVVTYVYADYSGNFFDFGEPTHWGLNAPPYEAFLEPRVNHVFTAGIGAVIDPASSTIRLESMWHQDAVTGARRGTLRLRQLDQPHAVEYNFPTLRADGGALRAVGIADDGRSAYTMGMSADFRLNLWKFSLDLPDPDPDPDPDPEPLLGDVNGDGMVNVAILGDSYISGEGQHDWYEEATNGANHCHRSHGSWAYQLALDLQAAAGVDPASWLLFAACSGARTEHVLYTAQFPGGPDVPGKRPQIDDLRDWDNSQAPVDIVFLSVGGNDAKFGDRIKTCVVSWDRCRPQMSAGEMSVVHSAIEWTIRSIRDVVGPQTRIVTSNYVDPIQPPRTCSPELLRASQAELIDLGEYLRQVNSAVAEGARRGGADVIDLADAFQDTGLCTDSGFMNGLQAGTNAHLGRFNKPSGNLVPAAQESFHPTALGHSRLLETASPQLAPILADPAPPGDGSFTQPPGSCHGLTFTSVLTNDNLETRAQFCSLTNQNALLLSRSIPTVITRLQLVADEPSDLGGLLPDTLYPGWHSLEIVSADHGDVLATAAVFVEPAQECPDQPSTGDADGDDLADTCDLDPVDGPAADYDNDTITNATDNCTAVANPDQADVDGDLAGDACDPDQGNPVDAGYRTVVDDTEPPTVTATLDPAANDAGWHNTPVTVTWAATDPLPTAGPPTLPPTVTVTADGIHHLTSEPSCDAVAHCAASQTTVKLDRTRPDHQIVTRGSVGAPKTSGTATDALSGIRDVQLLLTAPGNALWPAKSYDVTPDLTCDDARRTCTWSARLPGGSLAAFMATLNKRWRIQVTTTDRAGNTATTTSP